MTNVERASFKTMIADSFIKYTLNLANRGNEKINLPLGFIIIILSYFYPEYLSQLFLTVNLHLGIVYFKQSKQTELKNTSKRDAHLYIDTIHQTLND